MNGNPVAAETMHPAAMRNSRIEVLDGWRAISIFLVILSHTILYSSVRFTELSNTGGSLHEWHTFFVSIGILGVHIFFIISGFVICRGFVSERNQSGQISLTAFYLRRFLRIVPPIVMYVAVVAALHELGVVQSNRYILRTLTFTCNFPGADCGGYLGIHIWSLSVEEQFYLISPLIFFCFCRGRLALIGIVALLLCGLMAVAYYLGTAPVLTYIFGFMYIAFGVAWALGEARWLRFVSQFPAWSAYALLGSLPLIIWLAQAPAMTSLGILQPLIITAMLTATVVKSSRLKSFLLRPSIQQIGRASYGIYLWQQLVTYDHASMAWPLFAVALVAMVLWSLVSYRFLELPLIRLGSRLSANIRQKAALSRA